jgi:hypothetical protein
VAESSRAAQRTATHGSSTGSTPGVTSSVTDDHLCDLLLGDRADRARAWLVSHVVEAMLGDAPSAPATTRAARGGPWR